MTKRLFVVSLLYKLAAPTANQHKIVEKTVLAEDATTALTLSLSVETADHILAHQVEDLDDMAVSPVTNWDHRRRSDVQAMRGRSDCSWTFVADQQSLPYKRRA